MDNNKKETTVLANNSKDSEQHGIIMDKSSSLKSIVHKFNKYYTMTPAAELRGGKAYVFMTKPEMNICRDGRLTEDMSKDPYMENIHKMSLTKDIMRQLSSTANSGFLPIVTNRCMGLDPSDVTFKTNSSPETYRGWKVVFGTHSVESKSAPTLTLQFQETRDLLVFHTFKIWTNYMEMMSKGQVNRRTIHKKSNALDYAVTIYYIVVGENGHDIIFYAEYVGMFPTSENSSGFTSNETKDVDGMQKISVSFSGSFYNQMDPEIMKRFKLISSGISGVESADANYMGQGEFWGGQPFIKEKDGKYSLHFTKGGI